MAPGRLRPYALGRACTQALFPPLFVFSEHPSPTFRPHYPVYRSSLSFAVYLLPFTLSVSSHDLFHSATLSAPSLFIRAPLPPPCLQPQTTPYPRSQPTCPFSASSDISDALQTAQVRRERVSSRLRARTFGPPHQTDHRKKSYRV